MKEIINEIKQNGLYKTIYNHCDKDYKELMKTFLFLTLEPLCDADYETLENDIIEILEDMGEN